ncbi:bleomycin hydrolase [Propionibacterium cyclohexanicum]|uniref:Aminopeptidase n=1 Tax=Propionibacterium cyclohexanicum TaxID=64702 RepID=A0A1H9S7J4_9ACTN|nr:C1 family peptidase [Propionibacterium cyclohexanicum]SER80957.1 bleomycin hydrolase [Propionibacterium cyclohexanicum]
MTPNRTTTGPTSADRPRGEDSSRPAVLDPRWLSARSAEMLDEPMARAMRNAVTTASVEALSLDRAVVSSVDSSVSVRLDDHAVTDQKHSGRCWAFAGLNVLRAQITAELGLADFELSESFVYFHDLAEKCNAFLATAIRDAARPLDDREVRADFESPVSDGGYWQEFVDLVTKYGIVPHWAMPDAESATNSAAMNEQLCTLMRRAGLMLRESVSAGDDPEPIRRSALADTHRILVTHLGAPPRDFVWQYRDKDKHFVRVGRMTPTQFAERYAHGLADYFVLAHDPRAGIDLNHRYAIDRSSRMVGRPDYEHVSAELAVLKEAAVATIRAGEPVWFVCDVRKQREKKAGIWHARLHDYEGVYGVPLAMTKEQRLVSCEIELSHAMCLTGVDLVDARPRRWRVENSWGDEAGEKGYWTMDDSWFDEYVFQVVVAPQRVPGQVRAALAGPVSVLPSWDVFR